MTINRATLGRIQVDHTREEASGFQGNGHSSLGKSSYLEADSTYGSGAKVRGTPKLQRGDFRYSKTHDNLEAGMGSVQRPIEKDGLETVERQQWATRIPMEDDECCDEWLLYDEWINKSQRQTERVFQRNNSEHLIEKQGRGIFGAQFSGKFSGQYP
ncbi:hypothetical protein CMV_002946 [Castanea mollissima]|uniref:Uncharacterized protein n=1 Tax=Castanea mollissima TaxID=60419 RepID=A0A8J4RWV8_9ROSI|nr:hypothetical protein CMV_002946 [Castanea mollissima]